MPLEILHFKIITISLTTMSKQRHLIDMIDPGTFKMSTAFHRFDLNFGRFTCNRSIQQPDLLSVKDGFFVIIK